MMQTSTRSLTRLVGLGFLLVAMSVTACDSPPKTSTGGRLRVDETTQADLNSNQMNTPDLFAFGTQAGESLAMQVSQIPEIENSPTRVVIELGTITNKTTTTPSRDFEMIQHRLRQAIQSSRYLTDRAMVVERRVLMERETSDIMGEDKTVDLLQEGGGGSSGPARHDPALTYVLQGEFYETNRGNVRTYWFSFQLTNLKSRAIVWSDAFEQRYQGP